MNQKLLEHLSTTLFESKTQFMIRPVSLVITPILSVHFNQQKEAKHQNDDFFLKNSLRSFSWHALKSIEKFSEVLTHLNEIKKIGRCKILDLSFTSGLLALITERLGVKKAYAYVHDTETLVENFEQNHSKAKALTKSDLNTHGPFDLIFYDFRSFPSKKYLKIIAQQVGDKRLFFVTGLLGHHVVAMNHLLKAYGFKSIYQGWDDELNFVLYMRDVNEK